MLFMVSEHPCHPHRVVDWFISIPKELGAWELTNEVNISMIFHIRVGLTVCEFKVSHSEPPSQANIHINCSVMPMAC